MQSTSSRDRGELCHVCGNHVVAAFCYALTLVFALTLPMSGQAADSARSAGTASAGVTPIRMAGPAAAKVMAEALAAEYGKTAGQARLEYQSVELPSAAAGLLATGRDMILTWGKVGEKDVSSFKTRWAALAPEEHVIGARAAAIVVHARNNVDSLTMEQLKSIFSGKTAEWKILGGEAKSIRRYGLSPMDPLASLFHANVLPAAGCLMLQRKKDSSEILTALSSDPQGIAFVDAVAAMSAGNTIKIVGIGQSRATGVSPVGKESTAGTAVAPNAQTIKDGTYCMAETLVLYVSSNASPASKGFVEFILAGKGDAICRGNGFMPTLRAIRTNVIATFEKLYGPDIKRARETPDGADDIALAGRLIQSARTAKLDVDLLAMMCEAAYDLAFGASGGEMTAFDALSVLAERLPDKRFDCAVRRAALYDRAYVADQTPANGEQYVDALVAAAELGTSSRQFEQSADLWIKALRTAEAINSASVTTIAGRASAFEARRESLRQKPELLKRLAGNPQDDEARMRLFWLELVELDDPAEAAKYIDAVQTEEFKTNVPLAVEPVEKMLEDASLSLAEWYVGLVDKAGVGGKELMGRRARSCYDRFFELHKDRSDVLAMRATLGVQKVGGSVPALPAAASTRPTRVQIRANLKDGEEITDLKLAEFIAAHPDLTRLSQREIGSARLVTDLSPLTRLPKLTAVELHQADGIKDFSPLGQLPNLNSLTLPAIDAATVAKLPALAKLTNMDVRNAADLSDLALISRQRSLQSLNLSGCSEVADIAPLSGLASLSNLNLSNCQKVSSVAPLEKLAGSLTTLNLSRTDITDLQPLTKLYKLRNLDLRRCEGVTAEELEKLRKRLPQCKILIEEQK